MSVEYASKGRVGFITLNRPPANSYDHELMEELGKAVEAAAGDPEVRTVVVRSASDRFFSAGAERTQRGDGPSRSPSSREHRLPS